MHESQYIRRIHKHLPKEIYRWKIATSFSNGVADAYYSSNKGDMWIEYKLLRRTPKTVKPALSALQANWLNNRYSEGRNVAVVVGTPTGSIILIDKLWNDKTIVSKLWTDAEVAEWIVKNTRQPSENC